MHIAYILPSLQQPSGWRTHARALIAAVQPQVQPILFTARADEALARQFFPNLPVFTLPATQFAALNSRRGWLNLLQTALHIQRHAKQYPAFQLVHSLEAYPTGLIGHLLARKHNLPHSLTAHGTYSVLWQKYPLDKRLYAHILRRADAIFPVSHGTANLIQQRFPNAARPQTIHVIHNGNDFYKKINRTEALNRPIPHTPTLLTVGQIKPRKGHHLSLAAFAQVQQQLPNSQYWIVGKQRGTDYERSLHAYIHEHRLQNVHFWGELSDAELDQCYRQASVFVLAAQQHGLEFEGFGLVYLEANAYGLPVVATQTGGVADAVQHERTGILVPATDVNALAQAILRLLQNPQDARQLGQNGRDWAESLTWQRAAESHLAHYRRLLTAA
ncbi:MAG: hypothetical protein OHK0052_01230 [Anaerolineales bacterium]